MKFIFPEDLNSPWLRIATHIPYGYAMAERKPSMTFKERKFDLDYMLVANSLIWEGVCESFPPDELAYSGCQPIDLFNPRMWSYDEEILEWEAFGPLTRHSKDAPAHKPLLSSAHPNATEAYRHNLCSIWKTYYHLHPRVQRWESSNLGIECFEFD